MIKEWNMKVRSVIVLILFALVFAGCNDFFHNLIPPDGDRITSFAVEGQLGDAVIGDNAITVTVSKGTDVRELCPAIEVSPKASLIPITFSYVQAAFPQADVVTEVLALYRRASDSSNHIQDLIRRNPGFNVPPLDMPIDFSGPVNFLVISALGPMRQYSVHVTVEGSGGPGVPGEEDPDKPELLGLRFSKYDNPELVSDAICFVNEAGRSINALALYPVEMDSLSFLLIPSFEILGDSLAIDGTEIQSGQSAVQFAESMGTQHKTVTVTRGESSVDYSLAVSFAEDPDTIRSITDFRFSKIDNPSIAATSVASIVNNGDAGTINAQVFYSGAKPSALVPRFITPGTAQAGGVVQNSGVNSHDFSAPVEYRVVSRNGMYSRIYTVRVEFVSLSVNPPVMLSFTLSQALNPELIRDSAGAIGDGLITIDVYYGGSTAPQILVPEFRAEGLVTALGSVQVSGSSGQDFSRQIKYAVTNPENPLLRRDYQVQARLIRDTSSDAAITAFGFYPEENPGLGDPIIAKIGQDSITVFAPIGSGVTGRIMIPRFTAVGQVSVEGTVQSSGISGLVFGGPVTYAVVSANGLHRREYVVNVSELQPKIFVNQNAAGYNDGTSWQDAFTSLKDACEAAAQFPEDVSKEIWIAAGTYRPSASGNLGESFPLAANTSYVGGFAGHETARSQRNIAANKTIISGDLGGGAYSNNLFGAFGGAAASAAPVNGDLSFEGLAFTAAGGTAIGAALPAAAKLGIANCDFSDLAGSGIAIYVGGSGDFEITGSSIKNVLCTSASASPHGVITLANSGSANISALAIEEVQGGMLPGIRAAGAGSGIKIDGLQLRYMWNHGLFFDNFSGDIEISNADLQSISGSGIYSPGGSGKRQISGITGRNILGNPAVSVSGGSGNVTLAASGFDACAGISLATSGALGFVSISDTATKNVRTVVDTAVYAAGENIDIRNVFVENVPNGRGMQVHSSGSASISGSSIKNAKTAGNNGGGIFLSGSGSVEISGTHIEDVEAYTGGGIYAAGAARVQVIGGSVKNAKASHGGGIYFSSGGDLVISGTAIENVEATGHGSAIFANTSGTVQIIGGGIRNAKTGVGAVSVSGGELVVNNTVIEKITNANGTARAIDGSSLSVATIRDTKLEDIAGYGIRIDGGSVGMVSLSGITGKRINGAEMVYVSGGSSVRLYDSSFDTCSPSGWGIRIENVSGQVVMSYIDLQGIYSGGGIAVFGGSGNRYFYYITGNKIGPVRVEGGKGVTLESSSFDTIYSAYINGVFYFGSIGFYNVSGEVTIKSTKLQNIPGSLYVSGGSGYRNILYVTGNQVGTQFGQAVSVSGAASGYVITLENNSFDNSGEIKISDTIGPVTIRSTVNKNVKSGRSGFFADNCKSINFDRVTAENVSGAPGIWTQSSGGVYLGGCTIKNVDNTQPQGVDGGGLHVYGADRVLIQGSSRFENCTARYGGAALFRSSSVEIINTDFINCTASDDGKILLSEDDSYNPIGLTIKSCRFTHDGNLANPGSPAFVPSSRGTFFGGAHGSFEDCTFTNLRSNGAGESYIFNSWLEYPQGNQVGTVNYAGQLSLTNCTFNFGPGSAGLCALYTGTTTHGPFTTYLGMSGVTINNSGGQQPLIWLYKRNASGVPSNTFQFKPNNVYNGTTLNTAAAITGLGSGVIRLTYAVPTMVP
jgi:hypothetical protein